VRDKIELFTSKNIFDIEKINMMLDGLCDYFHSHPYDPEMIFELLKT